MNSILITQPIGTLDGIVHVPSPVVLVHVSKGGVDATLGGDSVTSGREKLGDTGSVEAGLSETEGGSQTGATCTDNEGIVLVILYVEKEEKSVSGIVRKVKKNRLFRN